MRRIQLIRSFSAKFFIDVSLVGLTWEYKVRSKLDIEICWRCRVLFPFDHRTLVVPKTATGVSTGKGRISQSVFVTSGRNVNKKEI